MRYGETVFLLEPNVKRSRGALRDIQLIRWIGFVRYGTADPGELHARGVLERGRPRGASAGQRVSAAAAERIALPRRAGGRRARSGRATSHRRAARLSAARPACCRSSSSCATTSATPRRSATSPTRFVAKAQSRDRMARLVTVLFGHRVEDGIRVGPAGIVATRRGLRTAPRRPDGHRAAGRSGESLRQADRRRHVGDDPPRAPPAAAGACRRRRPAAISSRCWAIRPGSARCCAICTTPASWSDSFPSSTTPAACCNSTSITSTRSTSIACGRSSLPRSLWSDAGPLGRVYRPLGAESTCCTWRC